MAPNILDIWFPKAQVNWISARGSSFNITLYTTTLTIHSSEKENISILSNISALIYLEIHSLDSFNQVLTKIIFKIDINYKITVLDKWMVRVVV